MVFTLSALSWQFLKANGSVDGLKQNKEGALMKLPVLLIVFYSIPKAAQCVWPFQGVHLGKKGLHPKWTVITQHCQESTLPFCFGEALPCLYVTFAQKTSNGLLRKSHFKN